MKTIRYEVRTKGDGEFDYFIDDGPCDDCGYDAEIDGKNIERARKHAKCCGGKVVRVTMEPVK